MNTHELQTNLSHFTGTENYYRVMPRLVITDGVRYLAVQANLYWLVSAIYSHLMSNAIYSEFVVARLIVSVRTADLVLDDGDGQLLSSEYVSYIHFRLDRLKIYCCYRDRVWVLMLPGEY